MLTALQYKCGSRSEPGASGSWQDTSEGVSQLSLADPFSDRRDHPLVDFAGHLPVLEMVPV